MCDTEKSLKTERVGVNVTEKEVFVTYGFVSGKITVEQRVDNQDVCPMDPKTWSVR